MSEDTSENDGGIDTPVADNLQGFGRRIAAEANELGLYAIVIYYTAISATWLGQDVGFLDVPFPRTMLAGLLLGGLVLDRFIDRNEPIPRIVVGYTVLALAVVGTAAGSLNMPLPDTTVSAALLALLTVDYFTPDRGSQE